MPNRTLSRSAIPNPNPSTCLNPSLTQSQLYPGAYNILLTQAFKMRLPIYKPITYRIHIFLAQSQVHNPILVQSKKMVISLW